MPDHGRSPLASKTFAAASVRGLHVRDAPPYVDVPGLAGFRLDFERRDHQISNVRAGFFRENESIALITEYADEDGDDPYSFFVDRIELPAGSVLHEKSAASPASKVLMTVGQFDTISVPVLAGFGIQTLNAGDHHLDRFGVRLMMTSEGRLLVDVNFQGGQGSTYGISCRVACALVPLGHAVSRGEESAGRSSGGSDSRTIAANHPVLQGFQLDFRKGGHHLDEVGVRLAPGSLKVFYNDKNDDDDFDWKVWWVDLK